jgi:F-type H+-transporting ATPase subunit b
MVRRPACLVIPLLFVLITMGPVAIGAGVPSARASIVAGDDRTVARAGAWFQSGESSGSSRDELFKLINFLIMVGVLVYVLRKPLSDFFADRLDSIHQALNQGRHAVEISEAKLAEIEYKLANVEREIAAFRAESEREMQAERERLKQSADLEAQRILEFAQVQIEAATRLAKAELKKYAAQQAVELAEALIRQRLDNTGRERLVGNFLAGLEKPGLKN